MAPAQMYSHNTRIASRLCPWLPNCVVTLYFLAAAAMARHSPIEWASGFSTNTDFPNRMAMFAATAW
jgi:hypothetical protein